MRVACLTGVSRGLGRSLFDAASTRFDLIIGVGRNFTDEQHRLEAGGRAKLVPWDLSESCSDAVNGLIEALPHKVASLLFVSNAAVLGELTPSGAGAAKALRTAIQVNCVAPAVIADMLIGHAAEVGYPLTILNVSSGAAERAIPGMAAYCASKAAADIYFRCVEMEHASVTVHRVDPGVMDTSMQAQLRKAPVSAFPETDQFKRLKMDGLLRNPSDVAREIMDLVAPR